MSDLVPRRKRWWLFVAAAVIALFLILPVLVVLPMSFSGSRYLDFPPKIWSTRWYDRFFTDIAWYSSMIVSLKLAVCTVLVATPIGTAAAYAIHVADKPIFKKIYTFLLMPLMIPNIILAIGIFYAFARIGFLGSFGGILLAHVMLALPFVIVTVLSGLRSFDMTQEQVARTLGCTRFGAFFRVTLPQIQGSIVSGAIFAFVTSLDEVVVALFIASGENTTVTKVMFSSLRDEIDPTIAAVSALLIIGSIVLATLAMLSARLGTQQKPVR